MEQLKQRLGNKIGGADNRQESTWHQKQTTSHVLNIHRHLVAGQGHTSRTVTQPPPPPPPPPLLRSGSQMLHTLKQKKIIGGVWIWGKDFLLFLLRLQERYAEASSATLGGAAASSAATGNTAASSACHWGHCSFIGHH